MKIEIGKTYAVSPPMEKEIAEIEMFQAQRNQQVCYRRNSLAQWYILCA